MVGWNVHQGASRLTLYCLIMLIIIENSREQSTNINQAAKQVAKRSNIEHAPRQKLLQSKESVMRLYDAYKLLYERSNEKSVRSAVNYPKVPVHGHTFDRGEDQSDFSEAIVLTPVGTKFDATDDRHNNKGLCIGPLKTKDVEDDKTDKEKPDVKNPITGSVTVVKVDMQGKGQDFSINPMEHEKIRDMGRIYNEYMKNWHKKIHEPKNTHLDEEPTVKTTKPQAPIIALTELTHTIKKLEPEAPISATKDTNSKPSIKLLKTIYQTQSEHNDNLSTTILEESEQNEIDKLFNSLEPQKASGIFKRLAKEMHSMRTQIKAGGLYDEYRKRLFEILKEQKQIRNVQSQCDDITSENDFPIDNEMARNANDLALGHLGNKSVQLASEKEEAPIETNVDKKNADEMRPRAVHSNQTTINGYLKALEIFLKDTKAKGGFNVNSETDKEMVLVENHARENQTDNLLKTPQKSTFQGHSAKNGYLKAMESLAHMEAKDNKTNGGIKPYFIPDSKNRQLIWNDIPLRNKGTPHVDKDDSHEKESKSASCSKAFSEKKEMATNHVISTDPVRPAVKENSGWAITKTNAKIKFDGPVTVNNTETYMGVEPKTVKIAMDSIQKASINNLYSEYQRQLNNLHKVLQDKQRWWNAARGLPSQVNFDTLPLAGCTGVQLTRHKNNIVTSADKKQECNLLPSEMSFPGVLTQGVQPSFNMPSVQPYNGVFQNMANELNLTPVELARRITSPTNTVSDNRSLRNDQQAGGGGPIPANLAYASYPASQTSPAQGSITNQVFRPKQIENSCEVPSNMETSSVPANMAPILEQILQRLQTIQENKNQEASPTEKALPCCFSDPTDGAPCDLNGSWESFLLGIRINIKENKATVATEEKPTCAQPKKRRSDFYRNWRQCVKITNTQIKDLAEREQQEEGSFRYLNISIEEIVPPRPHEIIENLSDWDFSAQAMSTLGGPMSISCRKIGSNYVGAFVGYCRTCGCMDTIFGSWTFCKPSRDCQDITTSIFDRRDMLRRYNMDAKRKNRYKEQLYNSSKFSKSGKGRQ